MKLFVIASVIAVATAARLEHLERGYLPPFGGQADAPTSGPNGLNGRGPNGFGPNRGSSLGARGSLGQTGSFGAATSNQYLPPNQSPTAGNGQFGSYQNDNQSPFGSQLGQPGSTGQPGFGNQPSFGLQSPFGTQPSSQYGTPQFGSSPNFQTGASRPGSQYQPSQYSATNRQYLAPKTSSNFQNIPQQDFDEETGYHY